jgi:hypothetical protein
LDDVQDDGTFDVEIKYIDKNGHIAIYVISTDEWVGGAKWVDAEPGEDLYDLEVPVMKRETMEAIVQGSGAEHPPGDGIVALQAASFNGVPLEGVDFGPLEGKEPYHGGPSTFSPGGATSSNGTAVYFGIISGPAGFELEFADSGQDYSLHSVLGHDTFTIARVKLDR